MMTGDNNKPWLDSSLQSLTRVLSEPSRILLRYRRQSIIRSAINAAVTFALVTTLVVIGSALVRRLGFGTEAAQWAILALGVAAVAFVFLRAVIQLLRIRIDPAEVAQRVDLQSRALNRLATALEFATAGNLSPFRVAAIQNAIDWSANTESFRPELAALSWPDGFLARSAGVVICLLLLAVTWKISGARGVFGDFATAQRARAADIAIRAADRPESEPNAGRVPPKDRSQEPKNRPGGMPGELAQSPPTPSDALRQEQLSAAADQAASPAIGAEPPKDHTSPGLSTPEQNPSNPADGSRALPSIALSNQGSSTTGPKNKNSVGSGSSQQSANQVSKNPDSASEGTSNSNQSKDSKNATQGNTDGQDSAPANQDAKSNVTGGSGGKNQESTGGEGSEPGQGGGKKARGANSGLLGVRTPDLFIGRELTGPEERMILPTMPTAQPSDPASAASAVSQSGDEPSLDLTDIPVDDEAFIGQYFRDFHDETTPK